MSLADPPKPPPEPAGDRGRPSRLVATIAATIACRIALNTSRRFIYPFAPDLSRLLSVPLAAVTGLIAVNWATNLLGLMSGPLADRFGYRRMMMSGMAMLAAGMLVGGVVVGGVVPVFGALLAAMFLAGLGKSVFDPALQAYIGERVPYRRRGLAVGFLETAWAGSTLVGIPVMAFLIDRAGWQSAFFSLGAAGLGGLILVTAVIPASRPGAPRDTPAIDFRRAFRELIRSRSALGIVGFAFLFNAAMDNLFVIYGAWLEGAFGLSLLAVGLGTSVIGAAELMGEFFTAGLADRIGLKRTATGGVAACILIFTALPFAARTAPLALSILFVLFFFFELSIVTLVSLTTELLPHIRATMIAAYYAAAGVGRVAGALLGGALWAKVGIVGISLAAAGISGLALCSLAWGLAGWNRR
jgi:predicted MFS family arabinose efflux permease